MCERAVVDFGTIYGWGPSGYTVVTYTDTAMFTGADSNPLFDSDDELVFLAGEAGASAPGVPDPEHTLPGTGVEVELTNPLTSSVAFVYLFEGDGVLDPGAGASPIPYVFYLEGGPYKTTYGAPGATTDFAVDLADEVDDPLLVSVEAYAPTGVADAGADTDQVFSFRFAPNPATGVARVHLSTAVSGLVTLELFNVSGRAVGTVLTEHVDAGPRVIEVDVSDLPVGVYFARAQGPEGSCRTSRMVVLR